MIVVNESHQGAVPMEVTTVGLDIAKSGLHQSGSSAIATALLMSRVRLAAAIGRPFLSPMR